MHGQENIKFKYVDDSLIGINQWENVCSSLVLTYIQALSDTVEERT
jgi:hypothetical protein